MQRLNFTKIKLHEKLITLFIIINLCETELLASIIVVTFTQDVIQIKKEMFSYSDLDLFSKNQKYFSREN